MVMWFEKMTKYMHVAGGGGYFEKLDQARNLYMHPHLCIQKLGMSLIIQLQVYQQLTFGSCAIVERQSKVFSISQTLAVSNRPFWGGTVVYLDDKIKLFSEKMVKGMLF